MLKTKEIEIEGQKYILRELSTDDICELGALGRKDEKEASKSIILRSIVEPKVDLKELPASVGRILLDTITELNGLGKDFTTVPDK